MNAPPLDPAPLPPSGGVRLSLAVALLAASAAAEVAGLELGWPWRVRAALLAPAALALVLVADRVRRLRPLGPMLLYDLVRTSRRGQTIGHRCFYAVVILATFFLVYWSWVPPGDWRSLLWRPVRLGVTPEETARFANTFFNTFMVVQLGVLLLITPIYTATAVSEEKERRTLEFILTTDLTDREIVLGMLGSRLGTLLLLGMTGLPIVSFLPFLGGVDPVRVMAGFAAAAVTVISLGSVSMLVSVYARTSLGAVIGTYFWAIVVFVPMAGFLSSLLLRGDSPTAFLAFYLGIHAFLAVVLASWAVAELRPSAMAAVEGFTPLPRPMSRLASVPEVPPAEEPGPARLPWDDRRPRRSDPVWDNALLWKELYTEGTVGAAGTRDVGKIVSVVAVVAVLAYLPGAFSTKDQGLADATHRWVQGLGTTVSCLTLVGVALSAASRLSRERERRTLDGLRALPIEPREILLAKWLASILSVRWLLVPLAALWAFGVVTGGLSPFALPWLVGAWLAYAGFVAALGLLFSALARTTLRAFLFTLLVGLVFVCGPGTFYRAVFADSGYAAPWGGQPAWDMLLLDYGLTPTLTLNGLAFRSADFVSTGWSSAAPLWEVFAALVGLQAYLVATALVGVLVLSRFEAEKGPRPRRVPPTVHD